ncbi:delta-1-pyrroline-5-carboxylate dehydrogenase [Perkinsela sp. CCAP 1560/4]|nr:delta-1-pyrroline-5-carboxylate dehydrogenase [Perkinsela sp. CCAP 1560/4]|eukprot:KNH07791.1 delta-1-pyrroline-5-carboxylate dehydrogenase [Perkinsela sp. CCAP 1560/4]
MLHLSKSLLVDLGKYSYRNPWYYPKTARKAVRYNVPANKLRNIKLDNVFRGMYFDNKHDMAARDNLDETEEMRSPTEKDFYQDHTYHSQWEERDLNSKQKGQLRRTYAWMAPGYQIQPWLWYPGDLVEIAVGDDRGKRGRIRNVLAYKNEIVVEGVNVQQEEIPATEDRPKQILYQPWPINVKSVRHVDESTDSICELRILTVKKDGELKKVRASTASGWVLPIPEIQKADVNGDPTLDTSYADAVDRTFHEKEIDSLANIKLEALEKHYIDELKEQYSYHREFQEQIAKDKAKFQHDVWLRAKEILLKQIRSAGASAKEAAAAK